jgi:hypothetical protein
VRKAVTAPMEKVCGLLQLYESHIWTRVKGPAKDSASELSNLALVEEFSNDWYRGPIRGFHNCVAKCIFTWGVCVCMYVCVYYSPRTDDQMART